MNTYQPYTYLIGWSQLDLWYYGVRYSQTCHPSDLWIKYFTSSTYVADARKTHGEPDVIEIRRTFNSPEKAMQWERKVLNRMKVMESDRWLNQSSGNWPLQSATIASREKMSLARKGKPKSAEHRAKISAGLVGNRRGPSTGLKIAESKKHLSDESRKRMSDAQKGKVLSEEHRRKISTKLTGRTVSDETKQRISNAKKNISDETRRKMSQSAKNRTKKTT